MASLDYLSTNDLMAGIGIGEGSTYDQFGKRQDFTDEVATHGDEESSNASVWDE